jgi:hypothetical protein
MFIDHCYPFRLHGGPGAWGVFLQVPFACNRLQAWRIVALLLAIMY